MEFHINLCKHQYRLTKVTDLNDVFMTIINEIINHKDGLLSFTMSPDEISLIITDELYQKKFSNEINQSCLYYAATIDTVNPGLNDYGILAELSKIFADRKIPILCFSTYNLNYILYPDEYHSNLLELINNTKQITLYHN